MQWESAKAYAEDGFVDAMFFIGSQNRGAQLEAIAGASSCRSCWVEVAVAVHSTIGPPIRTKGVSNLAPGTSAGHGSGARQCTIR